MTVPTVADVMSYLGLDSSWSEADVASALAAEQAAQAAVCRVPADWPDPWPADLVEALCRRVQRLLQMRSNPLGYQQSASADFGVVNSRIGADGEIARLERPYRRLVVG